MIKKTHEEFIKEIKQKFGDEYCFLERYQNAKTPILCRHSCGYEWRISPTNILPGKGCPRCKKRIHYTLSDAQKFFQEKGLILLADKYYDANTPMPYQCKKHLDKGIQYRTLSAIINTDTPGCRYCGYERSKEKQLDMELINEVKQCFAEHGLNLLENTYKGAKEKYLCSCLDNPDHGTFFIQYDNVKFLHQGCPICSESRGERKIRMYLIARNIPYEQYKTFDDLRGKRNHPLSFDFFLPDYNLLIEFQGKQHKEAIDYFGGQKQFDDQVLRDQKKEKYAKDNNLTLLSIWYDQINDIEKILDNYINSLKAVS